MRALVIALTLAALGMLIYSRIIDFDTLDATDTAAKSAIALAPADPASDPIAGTAAPQSAAAVDPAPTEKNLTPPLIELGNDARARAAIIDALATAPESQAVPLLQKVLIDGAEAERQLALNSLRTLALNQGDAAGRIRDVLRLVIYDGEDGVVTASAQAVLNDIEYSIDPVLMN